MFIKHRSILIVDSDNRFNAEHSVLETVDTFVSLDFTTDHLKKIE